MIWGLTGMGGMGRRGMSLGALLARATPSTAPVAAIKWVALVCIALLFLLGSNATRASEITCVTTFVISHDQTPLGLLEKLTEKGVVVPSSAPCFKAMLSGKIEKGDSEKLEKLLRTNIPFLGALALNSPGGDVEEAMKIGRVARRYYLATEAPTTLNSERVYFYGKNSITDSPGSICASACFFVWIGGVTRVGDVLGIHRPFPPDSEMQKLSPSEADGFYHNLSHEISSYLAEMDAQSHWLHEMMNIPPDSLHVTTLDEVREFCPEIGGLYQCDIPSFAQWESAKCGSVMSKEENEDLWNFVIEKHGGNFPSKMTGYYNYLEEKSREFRLCIGQAVDLARWELRVAPNGN